MQPLWLRVASVSRRRNALWVAGVAVLLLVIGVLVGRDVKIGDLHAGVPELRPDSTYNRDVAFMNANYSTSSDIFAVIVKSELDGCVDYEAQSMAGELEWRLLELEGTDLQQRPRAHHGETG